MHNLGMVLAIAQTNKIRMQLILLFLLGLPVNQTLNTKEIKTALSIGSAKELVKFCNATVEIKINDESSNYSTNQAEAILKKFFDENPPTSFDYIHQGSTDENIAYTIGRYVSSTSKTFRVVTFIKQSGSKYLIDTLNFSEE
ncbi:MAG: DUF4783 domain-containing protein [Bacteroidota bacterium]